MWGKTMTLVADEDRKHLTRKQKKDNSRKTALKLKKNMDTGLMIIISLIWIRIFSKQSQFPL